MSWRVLVSAPYMQPVIENYRHIFESKNAELIIPPVNERLEESELMELMGEIDGVIAGDDRFTRRVLVSSCPRLKVISKWGTGIDSFDLQACKELGITVCNTPGAFTEPVADSVLGYILSFARKLPWMNDQMKLHEWNKIPGISLCEAVLGIVGFGKIGQAVAKRAAGFGMTILANDILEIPNDLQTSLSVKQTSFEELLRMSDFVSLNCDLNPTSRHLINLQALKLMKSSAVVINLARGPVINEKDLIHGLKHEIIAGAALDVFESEPLPSDSPLHQMSNVMLAPHNSNSSPAAWLKVHENTIKNLLTVLERKT